MKTAPFHAGACNGLFHIYAGGDIVDTAADKNDAAIMALALLVAREDVIDGEIKAAAFEGDNIAALADCPDKLLRAASDLLRWDAWGPVQ